MPDYPSIPDGPAPQHPSIHLANAKLRARVEEGTRKGQLPADLTATDTLDGIITEAKLSPDVAASLGDAASNASVAVTAAEAALTTANAAQTLANTKITTFYAATAPTATTVGDLWLKTTDNSLYRWDGSTWASVQDNGIATALADAQTAQTTADGKIVSYFQSSAPTGASVGDLWYDTANGNLVKWWGGTAWQPVAAGSGAIADNAVTASKLEAQLILGSTIIAGDPNGWYLQLGDQATPILWTNGTNTGLAVSADPGTGVSNVSVTGQLAFGSGSAAVNDWIDLAEQQATGFMTPTMRQARNSFNRETATTTGQCVFGYTTPGNFLILSILAVGTVATPPTISTPTGWTLAASATNGVQRMSLFFYPNCPYTQSAAFTFDRNANWCASTFEYSGIDSLDLVSFYSGTSNTLTAGPTLTSGAANELWFVSMGSSQLFADQLTDTTNGFNVVARNWSDSVRPSGVGMISGAQSVTATGPINSSSSDAISTNTPPWLAVAASFGAKAVTTAVAPTPPTGKARIYTAPVSGASHLFIRNDAGSETSPTGAFWSQYTRGGGTALSANTPTRIGGYSLVQGAGLGISFSGGSTWTLDAGIWTVKTGLRLSGSSDAILLLSPDSGTLTTVHPGSEGSFKGVITGPFCTTATDISSTTAFAVNIWAEPTGTPTPLDGVISFNKIG